MRKVITIISSIIIEDPYDINWWIWNLSMIFGFWILVYTIDTFYKRKI